MVASTMESCSNEDGHSDPNRNDKNAGITRYETVSECIEDHNKWLLDLIAKGMNITMPGFQGSTPYGKKNRAEKFWIEFKASLQVNMALTRTAGEVASGSQQVVKQLIQKETIKTSQEACFEDEPFTLPPKTIHGNEGATQSFLPHQNITGNAEKFKAPSSASLANEAFKGQTLPSTPATENDDDDLKSYPEVELEGETNSEEYNIVAPKKKHKIAKPFTEKSRGSFGERFTNLGEKWELKSGTIVENVLFLAGSASETYSPIHSFMLDLDDPEIEKLFTPDDWNEIISDLPSQAQLGEGWWLQNAWGLCSKAAIGVPNSFILPGEKTGLESVERRNLNTKPTTIRRKSGYKTDLIWRTLGSPDQDWAVAEAATVWDPVSNKYKFEGAFKLPRHMHDILTSRTYEASIDQLRNEYVSGLLIGETLAVLGPVLQRLLFCWGTKGYNVTRFFRRTECRLYSDISQLDCSMDAIHEVLLFRTRFGKDFEDYFQRKSPTDQGSLHPWEQDILNRYKTVKEVEQMPYIGFDVVFSDIDVEKRQSQFFRMGYTVVM
ncbi:hypothetical protein BGZ76_003912 [Entomortierella beljakovae]|nr:hypothetical protein BGZ76_003912 [Entomortierella beljakovae]